MAKQKSKHPAKLAGTADAPAETAARVIAPGKRRGKRKVRAVIVPSAKDDAAGRLGKSKAKLHKQRPKAVATDAQAVKRNAPHALARRPHRMGPLERLELAIDEVRRGGRASPRTRKLQLLGVPKMAQKVIEEAGELAIEAVLGNRPALIGESVDLIYNLVVLLAEVGVPLTALWAEMERREVALGMAEKLPKAGEPES